MNRFIFLLLFGLLTVGCSESGLSKESTSVYGYITTLYSGDEDYVEDYSEENCSMCTGAGYGSYVTCPRCGGTGQFTFEDGNSMTCGGNGGIESAMFMMLDMHTAMGASGQSFCGASGKVFRPN